MIGGEKDENPNARHPPSILIQSPGYSVRRSASLDLVSLWKGLSTLGDYPIPKRRRLVVGFRIQPTTFDFPTPVDEKLPHFRGLRFLVIDDNPEGRFLVSKTLLRKFPSAELTECQTAETAFTILDRGDRVSLIVCHRTFELDGASLVRELRSRNATVPILMMSGINRTDAALAAGATAFLTYEEWLMVGNHVASLLSAQHAATPSFERTGSPSLSRN